LSNYVYILRGGGYLKVGQSTNVFVRLRGFNQGGAPFPLELVAFARCNQDVGAVEQYVQNKVPHRTQGEWFRDSGQTDFELGMLLHSASLFLRLGATMKIFEADVMQIAEEIHEKINRVEGNPARDAAAIFATQASPNPPKGANLKAPANWQESGIPANAPAESSPQKARKLTPAQVKRAHKAKMLERLERIKSGC